MTERTSAISLVVAAIVAVGCGSSSPKKVATPPSKPRLTKAQYVAAGNKICRATVQKSPGFPGKKVGNQYDSAPSLMIAYLQAVQNLTVQANKGLKILRPPKQLEKAHQNLLAAQQARITDMGLALNAASSRDAKSLNSAVQQDVKVDAPRYVAAANAAGLRDCTHRIAKTAKR